VNKCFWLLKQDKNKRCWQKRVKKRSLAEKPGQKQTLLAKKGKNCSWLGKSHNITDAGWRKRLLNNC